MRKITALTLITLIFITVGCMKPPQKSEKMELTYETPTQIEMHSEPQDAVFFVSLDWLGGPAGQPVFDLNIENNNPRPMEYDGIDMYLDDNALEKIDAIHEEKGGSYSKYRKLYANITINPDADGDVVLPPEENSEEPVFESRGYTEVLVNKLYDALPVDKWGQEYKE